MPHDLQQRQVALLKLPSANILGVLTETLNREAVLSKFCPA